MDGAIKALFDALRSMPQMARTASTHNDIAELAYDLWERRGRPFGSPEVDWFEAERQLKAGS
jgi:hypothetical protein